MIIDATEYDDSDDEEQALLDELAEWSRLEDAKAAPRGRPADDAAKIRTKLRVLRAALRACTSPRRRVALRERIHAERAWLDRLSAGVDASARRGHAREPSNGSDWSFFSHGTTGEGGSFHAPSPPRLFRFSADHARLDGAGALEALAKDLAAVARDARPAGRSLEGELDAAATGASARRTGGARSLSLELEAAADGVPDWYPPSAPESPPKHLASHPRVVDDLASVEAPRHLTVDRPTGTLPHIRASGVLDDVCTATGVPVCAGPLLGTSLPGALVDVAVGHSVGPPSVHLARLPGALVDVTEGKAARSFALPLSRLVELSLVLVPRFLGVAPLGLLAGRLPLLATVHDDLCAPL